MLFGLCRFVWIIDLLVTRLSPHPKTLTRPSTLEMLRAKEHTLIPYPFIVFRLGFEVEFIKELQVHHNPYFNFNKVIKLFSLSCLHPNVKIEYINFYIQLNMFPCMKFSYTFFSHFGPQILSLVNRKNQLNGEKKKNVNSPFRMDSITFKILIFYII